MRKGFTLLILISPLLSLAPQHTQSAKLTRRHFSLTSGFAISSFFDVFPEFQCGWKEEPR